MKDALWLLFVGFIVVFSFYITLVLCASEACAQGLVVCNHTQEDAYTAFAYPNHYRNGYVTRGWKFVPAKACNLVLNKRLRRQYYTHSISTSLQKIWGGKNKACISIMPFHFRGKRDCVIQGYTRVGFKKVNVNKMLGEAIVDLRDDSTKNYFSKIIQFSYMGEKACGSKEAAHAVAAKRCSGLGKLYNYGKSWLELKRTEVLSHQFNHWRQMENDKFVPRCNGGGVAVCIFEKN